MDGLFRARVRPGGTQREDGNLDILPRLKAGDSSYYADGSSR